MEHYLKWESLWTYVASPPQAPSPDNKVKVQKALATIILSVANDLLVHIMGKAKVQDAWDNLKAVYVQETAGSLISLTRQLYRTVRQPDQSVRSHLNSLATCFQLLAQRGKLIWELDQVCIILSSLSERFDSLITALESVDAAKLTLLYFGMKYFLEDEAHYLPRALAADQTRNSAKSEGRRGAWNNSCAGAKDNQSCRKQPEPVALRV